MDSAEIIWDFILEYREKMDNTIRFHEVVWGVVLMIVALLAGYVIGLGL